MLRMLPAVIVASVALLGAPAAATAITLSSLSAPAAAADTTTARAEVQPAVWAWGATGLVGVAAMVGFGATVTRRAGRRPVLESEAPVLATVSAEPATARFV